MSTRDGKSVSFRLGAPYSERLTREAERHNVSPGQYARMILAMHFEQSELLNLKDEVGDVHTELQEFRAEFKRAVRQ